MNKAKNIRIAFLDPCILPTIQSSNLHQLLPLKKFKSSLPIDQAHIKPKNTPQKVTPLVPAKSHRLYSFRSVNSYLQKLYPISSRNNQRDVSTLQPSDTDSCQKKRLQVGPARYLTRIKLNTQDSAKSNNRKAYASIDFDDRRSSPKKQNCKNWENWQSLQVPRKLIEPKVIKKGPSLFGGNQRRRVQSANADHRNKMDFTFGRLETIKLL